MSSRLVVLVSGSGTNLQALLESCAEQGFGARVVAVGADRDGIRGLDRARSAGIPTFVHRIKDYPSRLAWDAALAADCERYSPDLIVLAGFMKLVGAPLLNEFAGRIINTHPALLPSFPGMHGVRDALEHGVKITGCTIFLVDSGVDAGPIIAQKPVAVRQDDDEQALHERIKAVERVLLVDTVRQMLREGWTVQGRKVRIGR